MAGVGKRRKPSRGWALGTTLACMVALSVVLFTAVSAGISHLRMVTAVTNSQHATNLAEAALSKAVAELVKSKYTFGKNGTDRINISVPDLPGSSGVVTFNKSEFPDAYSTFNLESDTPQSGARAHSVPGRSVHLVARGRVGSSESWMECVYYKPPFPDGLAASGPIDAKALYLAGIRRSGAYGGGDPGLIPKADNLPANLYSNYSPNVAERLSARLRTNCRITGSAGGVGGVGVDSTSLVEGEVLPNSEPRAIPEIDIRSRMEALRPNAVDISSSGGDLELDKDWFSQSTSDLTVGGNLKLNGSVLLVTGKLSVAGAIEGTGVILVDGEVEIADGGSNVTSSDQVAIACTRNFKLHANAPEGNYFQGLVYCEGDFEAKDITVVGATVVNGKNGARGAAKLDNVRFVQSPGGVSLELTRVHGINQGNHSWSWSVTARPDPNGVQGDYLADAHLYFTDWEYCAQNHAHYDPKVSCSTRDTPLLWKNQSFTGNDSYAVWNSVSGITTRRVNNDPPRTFLPEVYNGNAYPNGMPIKLSPDGKIIDYGPMRQEVFNFVVREGARQGYTIGGDGNDQGYRDQANRILNVIMATDFTEPTFQMTFTLNNLLGEAMGSSRTLVWRPFR